MLGNVDLSRPPRIKATLELELRSHEETNQPQEEPGQKKVYSRQR